MFQLVLSTPFEPEKETITLSYRGVSYEVPKNRIHRPSHSAAAFTTSMQSELTYRGVRYNLNSAPPRTDETKVRKQLIYRGATYEI